MKPEVLLSSFESNIVCDNIVSLRILSNIHVSSGYKINYNDGLSAA